MSLLSFECPQVIPGTDSSDEAIFLIERMVGMGPPRRTFSVEVDCLQRTDSNCLSRVASSVFASLPENRAVPLGLSMGPYSHGPIC